MSTTGVKIDRDHGHDLERVVAWPTALVVVSETPSARVVGMTSGKSAEEQPGHPERDRDEGAEEGPALAAGSDHRAEPGHPARAAARTKATAEADGAGVDLGPEQEGDRDNGGAERRPGSAEARARRARIRPSVLSEMNIAPWVRNSSSVVTPAQQGVGIQQVEEAAGVLQVGVDRHAAQDVGEGDAPQQRRHERADDDGQVPVAPPARRRPAWRGTRRRARGRSAPRG